MKIQFKKLSWIKLGGAHECYTTPFRFMIWETEQGLFLLETHSHIGLEQRVFCQHLEEAKNNAQKWLEVQLSKFIETSKTPAL